VHPTSPRALLIGALSLLATARIAQAQELRGRVVDSASAQPVLGAVLILLDADSKVIARNLTNERGEFRPALSPQIARMRVLRIGFRPREVRVPAVAVGAVEQLNVTMVSVPSMLEPVRVSMAPSCPRRPDATIALSLLEQARAGLLAAVVARESNRATLKRLSFERTMDGTTNKIVKQTVRVDSSSHHSTSFQAATSADVFVRDGFARDSAGQRIYYGPDAEVLLDDAFSRGYCFHLQNPSRERPHQAGIAFAAQGHRKARIDVEGTLWIDTLARALRDLEFQYVGLDRDLLLLNPGGKVSFRDTPNGVVLVDRWWIRVGDMKIDTTFARDGRPMAHAWAFAREFGGEVAHASWSDGPNWQAPLGMAHIRVVDTTKLPMTAITLRLAGTDYVASPDEMGNVVFRDLLPGPYTVLAIDAQMASAGIAVGTPLKFSAERDSMSVATLVAPNSDAFVKSKCSGSARWVQVSATTRAKEPVPNAVWEMGEDLDDPWALIVARGQADELGTLGFCDALMKKRELELRLWRPDQPDVFVRVSFGKKPKDMTVTFPDRR